MACIDRRTLLGCAGAAVFANAAHAQPPRSPAANRQSDLIDYPSVNDGTLRLRAFQREPFILLIAPERTVERASTDRILEALAKAWSWYRATFVRDPMVGRRHAGGA